MTNFKQAYDKLNDEQKKAVEHIYGPLLVIAGPGTGKTQLLALRAANILKKTDSDPQNILCLTFTESAQTTMRERLQQYIGEESYKVAVHTFHSFANEIISSYPQYFGEELTSVVADKISSYEILREIFQKLPHNNKISVKNEDSYVYLEDSITRISHLKKAGLSADDLDGIIKRDKKWVSKINNTIKEFCVSVKPISKKKIVKFEELLEYLKINSEKEPLHGIWPLSEVAVSSLENAISLTLESNKTTPLTNWKNEWMDGEKKGLKASSILEKLDSLNQVYRQYQQKLSSKHLKDFDDLILDVIEEMEKNQDLKSNLQEKFQFIMVDEYQDTNGSQQKLLEILSENPYNENQPNLMVVGDDDQAIFSFQGANPKYMTLFTERWSNVVKVKLIRNYRSSNQIIEFAKSIIAQAPYRKNSTDPLVGKEIISATDKKSKPVRLIKFQSKIDQYWGLSRLIKDRLENSKDDVSMAIIAPKHKMLQELVPYLLNLNIPIQYEKRDDILSQPNIRELLLICDVVQAISENKIELTESLLPELLSMSFWSLDQLELWDAQLHNNQKGWLEKIRSSKGQLQEIGEFIFSAGVLARSTPLETMIDILIGKEVIEGKYRSPFYNHYFSQEILNSNPEQYLNMVSSLVALRDRVSNFKPNKTLMLKDFTSYCALAEQAGENIESKYNINLGSRSVHLLSSHKSKGMEFNTVILFNADQSNWFSDRDKKNFIRLNQNLPIDPFVRDESDKVRRFYVSITRAADELIMSHAQFDEKGSPTQPLAWLINEFTQEKLKNEEIEEKNNDKEKIKQISQGLEFDWRKNHRQLVESSKNLRLTLKPKLEKYNLSASHLNTFLDIGRGGPNSWLVDKLIRFPTKKNREAIFGIAVHEALHKQHCMISEGQAFDIEKSIEVFVNLINKSQLGDDEKNHLIVRGKEALKSYLINSRIYFHKDQKSEYTVPRDKVVINGVRVNGIIDLIELDKTNKSIIVVDYKTGRSFSEWKQKDVKHNLKLNRYKKQLIFYKLMIEGYLEFSGYKVKSGELRFVEPDENGNINTLQTNFEDNDIEDFRQILVNVWNSMINLNFPKTDDLKEGIRDQRIFLQRLAELNNS